LSLGGGGRPRPWLQQLLPQLLDPWIRPKAQTRSCRRLW
jgi:hypothetical protein